MVNSLQLEFIKQIYSVNIRNERDAKITDFQISISEDLMLSMLDELQQLKLIDNISVKEEIYYRLTKLGRTKIKVVLTGGAYDLLHTGHITTLKEAAKYGDFLLVVVAKDSTVEGHKRKPIHSEKQRMDMLNELTIVDLAVIGDRTDHMAIVRKALPDIIAIGSDQDHRIKLLQNQLEEQGYGKAALIRLTSNLEGLSTTEVITEILERFV
ncbi:MAG: adenylyltransferase/cytidyltransferase family protein [Candidatus Heimdallarchaeota archaeon]|nr:adenylyltransferase/cytidyltransferase family protein [Candidatus Heimdallarchaeota archaeon]